MAARDNAGFGSRHLVRRAAPGAKGTSVIGTNWRDIGRRTQPQVRTTGIVSAAVLSDADIRHRSPPPQDIGRVTAPSQLRRSSLWGGSNGSGRLFAPRQWTFNLGE